MTELIRPTVDDTRIFLRSKGLLVDRFDFLLPFPGVFYDRRVVKVYDKQRKEERVLKARPSDVFADHEIESMMKIMKTYRYSGGRFRMPEIHKLSSYVVLNMPYLGEDLLQLAESLDIQQLGYGQSDNSSFPGFAADKIDSLCSRLRQEHEQFARTHSLIHRDLWQRQPNNIVYHSDVDRLLLVDAEGLSNYDEENGLRFHEEIDRVQEWMHESLLV